MSAFEIFTQACLRAPGEGVFTVSNARERKAKLHKKLYGSGDDVKAKWLDHLKKSLSKDFSGVATLGICSDTGGGIQRGANWGPLFVRDAILDLGQWPVLDLGDVAIVPQLLHDKYINQETLKNVRQALYEDANSSFPVSPLSIAEEAVRLFNVEYPKAKIFGIGGDHSVSYALVKAWAEAPARKNKKLGLIHFDAHTDLMVERLGIDVCFATWVPPILPLLKDPSNAYQIGIRSSAKEREHWESTFGLKQLWAKEIKTLGLEVCLKNFADYLKAKNFDEVYISFDIDALDSEYAPATGTPEDHGIAPHEAKLFIDVVGKHCKVTGADMVEVAPFVQIYDNPMGQKTTLLNAAILSRAMTDLLQES